MEDRNLLRAASSLYRKARATDVLRDEEHILRPFFEPMDVVIAADLLTLCKQMNAVWDVQLAPSVLKGIVTDGKSVCQLVLLVRSSTEALFIL